eukprot:TRINITY_DN4848_c0_g2_i1.p1 TRINITY_DN4848_c0_g2~~TRINITY_DN4848_c0_g2_i1.p1  ORF type:complete len:898 (+),score=242.53 TRINITY_DN4848_c0_g2_i1:52-2694(+)
MWDFRLLAACCLVASIGGTKISTKQPFDCSVEDLKPKWMGKNELVVNCLQVDKNQGREGAIWHSEDSGANWQMLSLGECDDPSRCVYDFTEEDFNHGFMITKKGGMVWTRNQDVTRSLSDGKLIYFTKIIPHPKRDGRVLGLSLLFQKDCNLHYDCPHMLHYSTDFGKTFTMLLDFAVWQAGWGSPSAEYYDPDEVFLIIKKGKETGNWSPKDWNWLETYHIKTKKREKLLHDVTFFLNVGRYTYYLMEGKVAKYLMVSTSNGRVAVKTEFPTNKAEESWRIMLTSDDATFVAVYHTDCKRGSNVVSWGSLYQSDATGEDFVTSMADIRWGLESRLPDFHKVNGIDGVFIANTVLVDEEQCRLCNDQQTCRDGCRYVTRISLSNGDPGSWKPIPAPKELEKECKNANDCNLHLHHGASAQPWIMSMHTRINSPGIIMGVGNVGDSLDVSGVTTDLFLSIDGGEVWNRAQPGPHAYDWSNYGGFIVIVETNKKVNSFKYSLDMGRTWDGPEIFTQEDNVMVYKVEASGGRYSTGDNAIFNLYSYNAVTGNTAIWRLDLGHYRGAPCLQKSKALIIAGQDPNFHTFRKNDSCFMGAKVEYIQKRGKCWNKGNEASVESSIVSKCTCNLQNYECDHGFREVSGGECHSEVTKEAVFDIATKKFRTSVDHHPPKQCSGGYNRKTGYILRPGHKCEYNAKNQPGALNLNPVLTACPSSGSSGGWFGTLLLVLFLILVFGVAGVYIAAFMGSSTAYGIKLLLEEKFSAITSPFVAYMSVRGNDPDGGYHDEIDGSDLDDNDEYVSSRPDPVAVPHTEVAEMVEREQEEQEQLPGTDFTPVPLASEPSGDPEPVLENPFLDDFASSADPIKGDPKPADDMFASFQKE